MAAITTNVPPPTFGPRGFIPQPDSAILSGRQQDINQAFGGNLNYALNTPQGQIASSESASIASVQQTFCAITNQVDPAFANGRMQDAIARIYFLTRDPPLPTVLQVLCNGAPGVVIPENALIRDTSNNIYSCTGAGTILPDGNITLSFACQTVGPIPVPDTNDVFIYQSIPGWDAVTCTSGEIGQNAEGRAAFEARREASVAGNSFGAIGSIIGAVAKVSGVLDFFGYDNGTASPVTVLGFSVAARSIYIAVSGGSDADVAQAIWSKKSPGCGYAGNTTVTVYDNNPLYAAPIPYSVTFERPGGLDVLFAVNIVNGPTVPSNAVALVQNAIIQAFAGEDGGQRARIGSLLLATRYYAPVALLGSWAQIRSLQIGSANTPAASFTGVIAAGALTASSITGTIAIGQTISDGAVHIPQGTTIVSGSGSAWVTSNSGLNVSSEAMVTALANTDSVQVQANQAPSVSAANIAVTVS